MTGNGFIMWCGCDSLLSRSLSFWHSSRIESNRIGRIHRKTASSSLSSVRLGGPKTTEFIQNNGVESVALFTNKTAFRSE